jgi:metal-sulfur cluster biosynthetic enzyme
MSRKMDVVKIQFTEEELNWLKEMTAPYCPFEPEIQLAVKKKIEQALKKVK